MPLDYDPNSEWEAPVIIGGTPATPVRMNKIEDGLKAVSDAYDALEAGDTTIGAATPSDGDVLTYDTVTGWGAAAPTGGGGGGAVDSVNGQTGTVVLDQDDVGDGTTYKQYSATEKSKLAGVANGATANDTDANLKNRANHTGTQTASTISDFAETTRDTMGTALVAGTGIAITVNDGADTITIDATGGGSVPDATTSVKGVVQLAGDLGGTAASPTVPGLSGKVALSTIDAKGDLLVGTANDTISKVGVGSNGQVLTADSTQTAGVKWATPSAGATVGAAVYLNAATLASATGQRTVLFDTTEIADTGFSYNSSTGELTITDAGWYSVYAHVRLQAGHNGYIVVYVYAGSNASVRGDQATATTLEAFATGVDYYAAGTVLHVELYSQNSSQISGGDRHRTTFRVVKL